MRAQSVNVCNVLFVSLIVCFISVAMSSLPGGNTNVSVDDPEVKAIVQRATTKYNEQTNSLYYQIPVEIVKAQSQVVAGIKYTIEVLFGQSSCAKNQVTAANATKCTEANTANRKKVTISAWQKPWENFEEITFA